MSGLGGGILGSIMVVDLLLESGGCRSGYGWVVEMMMFAIVSGLLGSLVRHITRILTALQLSLDLEDWDTWLTLGV